ncbi:smalltalk protein [Bacteroides sp. 224]|nr:smalltalk protein [Bacteroides sp. 224]
MKKNKRTWDTLLRVLIAVASAIVGAISGQAMNN